MKFAEKSAGGDALAHRVVWVAVTSALVGSLVAAIVGIVAVDSLLADKADERLMGAVATLESELDEALPHGNGRGLTAELADENRELEPSGIELSVFSGKHKLAGLGPDRTPDVGDCETQGMLGVRVRSCSRRYGNWVLVASQYSDTPELRWLYLLAALGACAAGAATGGILGLLAGRSAVRPLVSMTERLQRLDPETGAGLNLGAASGYREVDAIGRAITELIGRIQGLLAQAERFAGDASHELRTPLTALCAELELTAESLSPLDRVGVERAHSNAVRLCRLVERLLMLALPEARLPQGFEILALEEVLARALGALGVDERSRIQVEQGGEGLVRGDQELLRSMMSNAINNALEHGGRGRIVVRLVDPSAGDPWVRFEVSDEGPGVPPEYRTRVFEPFFRMAGSTRRGHGLGLALIAHVARAHGGCAEFLDAERGAHLEVRLPSWTEEPTKAFDSSSDRAASTMGVRR